MITRSSLATIVLLIGGIAALDLAPAWAQSRNEFLQLLKRMEALEDNLSQVRRQAGIPEPARAPATAGAAVTAAPVATAPSESYEKLFERQESMRAEVDGQIRELTGAVEKIAFEVDRLTKRIDKMVRDVDVRLADLEKGTAAGRESSGAPAPQPTPAPQQTAARPQPALPDGTPKEQYDFAYGLLRQLDFDRAERALKAFLERHPSHELAENSRYWLGETYFARKNYPAAAEAFLDGYKRNRDGRKAADNLLKLGISLTQLGQKAEACTTFRELQARFGASAKDVRDLASTEQKKAGCT